MDINKFNEHLLLKLVGVTSFNLGIDVASRIFLDERDMKIFLLVHSLLNWFQPVIKKPFHDAFIFKYYVLNLLHKIEETIMLRTIRYGNAVCQYICVIYCSVIYKLRTEAYQRKS